MLRQVDRIDRQGLAGYRRQFERGHRAEAPETLQKRAGEQAAFGNLGHFEHGGSAVVDRVAVCRRLFRDHAAVRQYVSVEQAGGPDPCIGKQHRMQDAGLLRDAGIALGSRPQFVQYAQLVCHGNRPIRGVCANAGGLFGIAP